MVRIDYEFLLRTMSRPGTGFLAPTNDQLMILGIEKTAGWAQRLIDKHIELGLARTLIHLGERQNRKFLRRRTT